MITWSTPVVEEEKRPIPCNLCGGEKFIAHLSCGSFSYVRCADCNLVQVNPQPLEEEVRKRYDTAFGGDYLAYELANENNFLNLQLLAINDIGISELEKELAGKQALKNGKLRVLDIGCATGALLSWLIERGWEGTGLEISGPQAEYGRLRKSLDVRSLPLKENHFPEGSYEMIWASHLIEHLNNPADFVREVQRILVPGGRFLVTTPNIAGFQARFFQSSWRSAIFDHLYLFSVKTLSRLLKENGFIIEKIVTWGGLAIGTAPAPVKYVFDRAAKRFGFGDVMIIRAKKSNGN